jgi:hypothetical protein
MQTYWCVCLEVRGPDFYGLFTSAVLHGGVPAHDRGHPPEAPWYIVPADDKRRARLNLIRHLLDSIPYKKVDIDPPKIPKAQLRPKGAMEGLGAGRPVPGYY